MQAKLTLSIDKSVINRAKMYARDRKKSLSRIIEDYLKSISNNQKIIEQTPIAIPPITKSLGGILSGKEELDFRSSMAEYLEKRHR